MKDVVVVAMCSMMSVLICGTYFDALFKVPRVETVECGVDIQNMARKLNITLVGNCEVIR